MRSADRDERCDNVLRFTFSIFPCSNNSNSRVDASKFTKYGSNSCSLSLRVSGGKRPRISGPGFTGGETSVFSVGDVGEPALPGDGIAPPVAFSFAEEDGTGSHPCAGLGFAGSRGGALRLFFGIDEAGWECRTSL